MLNLYWDLSKHAHTHLKKITCDVVLNISQALLSWVTVEVDLVVCLFFWFFVWFFFVICSVAKVLNSCQRGDSVGRDLLLV